MRVGGEGEGNKGEHTCCLLKHKLKDHVDIIVVLCQLFAQQPEHFPSYCII